MHKWLTLPIVLVAFALSTPARAQVFGLFAANDGPEQVVVEAPAFEMPAQSTIIGGGPKYGYPFNSGCCEPKSACCSGLWDNYCFGSHLHGFLNRCKTSCALPQLKGHGYHLGSSPLSGYGWGHSTCGKGGCGLTVGGKGCATCAPMRLGLFDWLHHSHGKGCGCDACAGGKGHGHHGKGCSTCGGKHAHPHQGTYDAPPADELVPSPPQVHVAPTSDRSAGLWLTPRPVRRVSF